MAFLSDHADLTRHVTLHRHWATKPCIGAVAAWKLTIPEVRSRTARIEREFNDFRRLTFSFGELKWNAHEEIILTRGWNATNCERVPNRVRWNLRKRESIYRRGSVNGAVNLRKVGIRNGLATVILRDSYCHQRMSWQFQICRTAESHPIRMVASVWPMTIACDAVGPRRQLNDSVVHRAVGRVNRANASCCENRKSALR